MSQQRILELRSILDRLAYEYYVLDQPSKSDQEYDRYYQELVALEDEFPQYRDPQFHYAARWRCRTGCIHEGGA